MRPGPSHCLKPIRVEYVWEYLRGHTSTREQTDTISGAAKPALRIGYPNAISILFSSECTTSSCFVYVLSLSKLLFSWTTHGLRSMFLWSASIARLWLKHCKLKDRYAPLIVCICKESSFWCGKFIGQGALSALKDFCRSVSMLASRYTYVL